MKKRTPYLIGFLVTLALEICIGAFVRDSFIRPYVGDVLVTVLLCSLGRTLFPDRFPWLPAAVLVFAAGVECFQLIDIPALDGTLLGIILGSTFDPADLICYTVGCLLFIIADTFTKGGAS